MIKTVPQISANPSWVELTRLINTAAGKNTPPALADRMVSAGLHRNEINTVLRHAKSSANLPEMFYAIAETRASKGRYWEDLGLKQNSREYFFHAALWSFYAFMLAEENQKLQMEIYSLCSNSYASAAPLFKYPSHPVKIPYGSMSLNGYLRLPDREEEQEEFAEHFPCVVIINGLNSTKEELHFLENSFLNLGMASLSFDNPGIGESLLDKSEPLSAALLSNSLRVFLSSRAEIDAHSVALYGIGFGGALALQVAAVNPGIYKSVTTLSAPFDPEANLEILLTNPWRHFNYIAFRDDQEITNLAATLSTKDVAGQINCPLMLAAGGKDPVCTSEQTQQIFELAASPDKKLLLCPNAGHALHEMMPSLRYEIANWIHQRL